MGLESTSYSWLHDGLMKVYPAFTVIERVENGLGAGMADVNYLIRGIEGWIEMKAVDLPKRSTTKVLGDKGCNIDQINWHRKRAVLSGRTFIFISANPYRWLVGGVWAPQVNEWTAEQLCERSRVWQKGNWKPAHWRLLADTLQRG